MMFSWWFLQYPQRATFFFFNDTATTEIYTLSLHDALPICGARHRDVGDALQPAPARVHDGRQRSRQYSAQSGGVPFLAPARSEEHTSELQSQSNLVCRLLLEKKKNSHHSTHRVLQCQCDRA